MKLPRVSISDIARDLGVSPSTVSRALKNHPDISPATCRRVQEYARRVHYRPNALALGLKQQHSNTIGIIIPEIIHHFFSSIISGIEDLAYSKGYRIMICQSNEQYLREVVNLQALLDHRVDGLLVSLSKETLDHRHFLPAVENMIPMVFLDRVCDEISTDRVITDDFQGAYMATAHLLEKGCRRILHLAAPQHLAIARQRLQGYLSALKDKGVEASDEWVLVCDTPDKVHAMKKQLLGLAPSIDGLFAVNDFTAILAMQLFQENGYEIPRQIAVAGFGDDPIARVVRPTLTTVEQKGYDMGREAVRMLLQRLENPRENIPPRTRTFQAILQPRDSTRTA